MELFKIFGTLSIRGVDKVEAQLNKAVRTINSMATRIDALTQFMEELKASTDTLGDGLGDLTDGMDDSKKSTDGLSDGLEGVKDQVEDTEEGVKDSTDEMQDDFEDTEDKVKGLGDETEKTSSKFAKFGSVAKVAGKAILAVTTAVATASVALIKKVSSSYGELQQSIGGIETLFGESAQKVIDNANNAFQTAGISANEYMRQATSFSASLLNALGGDTEKAANVADMAIRDMADNANKMGTSMEMIQNAYQGFSRQNYVMLDNLKLGYGGTKTEMERLLADAEKLSGIHYDISNLNDVFEAIHVIQENLGITGTTALEAGETVEGSFNSLGASWENFLASLGNPQADMDAIVGNLAKGLEGAINNVTPIIDNMVKVLPTVMDALLNALDSLAPTLIETFTSLVTEILDAIVKLLPQIIPSVVDLLLKVSEAIIKNLPLLMDAIIQLVVGLSDGFAKMLPTLLPIIVDVVVQIADTLVKNLPLIVKCSMQLFMGLIEGITQALPQLIEALPVLISTIVDTLLSNLPLLTECAVQLAFALIKGFMSILGQLPVIIPMIIAGITDGLMKGIPNMLQSGLDLMDGLFEGLGFGIKPITNLFRNLISGIQNMWSNFTSWIKKAFKMPHLKFSGSMNPVDWFKGKMPKIGVEWYAEGGIMTKPTMFGVNPSTGNAMVGGEAGKEAILPIDKLETYVTNAVRSETNGIVDSIERLTQLLGSYLPDIRANMDRPLVLDSGAVVSGTVDKMDRELGNMINRKLRFGV